MDIGILGGTFDPPHNGHLWIAQQILEDKETILDKVWIIPNTGSGCYGKKAKTLAGDRLIMCQLMIKDFLGLNSYSFMEVSDVDIKQSFDYTYQLAEYLKIHYSDDNFHLIIGGDWEITKFKEWERLIEVFNLIQVHRPGFSDVETSYDGNSYGVGGEGYQNIEFKLSSSTIRKRIAEGKTIRGLVTPSVEQFILEKGFYRDA